MRETVAYRFSGLAVRPAATFRCIIPLPPEVRQLLRAIAGAQRHRNNHVVAFDPMARVHWHPLAAKLYDGLLRLFCSVNWWTIWNSVLTPVSAKIRAMNLMRLL